MSSKDATRQRTPQAPDPARQDTTETASEAEPDLGPAALRSTYTRPAIPTARSLRQSQIQRLQRDLGNARVTRMLIQRHGDDGAAAAPAAPTPEKEEDRFEEIRKILQQTDTGKESLKLMDQYRVTVQFTAGGGSYFSGKTNTITIDTKHPPARAALTFVHEMNHARYHHEGITANVKTMSREEYVKKMTDEEAEGVIKSIEQKIELEGTTVDVSKFNYPLEKQYRQAYQDAINAARAADPSLGEAELKKRARAAGKQRVIEGFNNGEVKTSNTKEPYPDYYGKYWDKVHAGSQ